MDFGLQNRMSKIFQAETGKTVMLAVDHGYFQGPTTGLENLKKTIKLMYKDLKKLRILIIPNKVTFIKFYVDQYLKNEPCLRLYVSGPGYSTRNHWNKFR